jgi:hypothetical protein
MIEKTYRAPIRITNENLSVQEKVNYFIARFNYFLSNAGISFQFDVESQLSLLEKVDFQIKGNLDNCVTYVDEYFKNPLFDNEELWENYSLFTELKKYINDYDNSPPTTSTKNHKKGILMGSGFHEVLEKLIVELKDKMADNLGEDLISVFQCKYPLTEHDHIYKLNLLAQLIISGGFFSKKTNAEVNEIIERIFRKGKDFPYPPDVKTGEERKAYWDEGLLSNQIKGFTSLLRRDTASEIIITKLYGAELPVDFEYEYDGVKFLGIDHPMISQVKKGINKKLEEIFEPGEYIFISVPLKVFSDISIFEKIVEATKNQIRYFSSRLGYQFMLDQKKNFIVIDNDLRIVSYRLSLNRRKTVNPFQLEDLLNGTTEILKNEKETLLANWFLEKEHLFTNALTSVVMSDLWIYIEALLPSTLLPEGVRIKELVSTIMLIEEEKEQQERIITQLTMTFTNYNGHELLGIDYNELRRIEIALDQHEIPDEIRKVNDPFVKELLIEFDKPLDSIYLNKAKEYYSSMLTEAYGNRNSYVHQGLNNDAVVIKLEKTLPYLIARFRWILIDAIKLNLRLSPDELLIKLYAEGKLLLS